MKYQFTHQDDRWAACIHDIERLVGRRFRVWQWGSFTCTWRHITKCLDWLNSIDWFNYPKKYKHFFDFATNILSYSDSISIQNSIMSIQNSSKKTQFYFDQFFCKSDSSVFFEFTTVITLIAPPWIRANFLILLYFNTSSPLLKNKW